MDIQIALSIQSTFSSLYASFRVAASLLPEAAARWCMQWYMPGSTGAQYDME